MKERKKMRFIKDCGIDEASLMRRTCVHEAGHAVSAFALGWKLEGVEFHPAEGPGVGKCNVRPPAGKSVRIMKEDLLIGLGGAASEALVLPGCSIRGAGCDYSKVAEIARRLIRKGGEKLLAPIPDEVAKKVCIPSMKFPPGVRNVLRRVFVESALLLDSWRPAIHALASVFEDGFKVEPGQCWFEVAPESIESTIKSAMSMNRAGRKVIVSCGIAG
jgi:hypothetical protein